jgi:hypothetical protein
MRGAGGSEGGIGRFFIGLFMIIAGIYLFLDAVYVTNSFAWSSSIYRVGGFGVTPGIILIPFLIGVGMIFYNAENDTGWVLVILTLVFLAVGVISNINFQLRNMSALELLMILGLFVGGIGLFLSSLRSSK